MMEIRRIHEGEGDTVGGLWDRMGIETEDGGPLTATARRDLSRMLAISAWHRDAFCLVALVEGWIVGFVSGRLDYEAGLLPCLRGEIDSLYVVPEERAATEIRRALAEAAITWLRDRDARIIRTLSDVGDHDDHRFWRQLAFEPDMVCLSLYRDE
jgi:GNAT superfamily N-acetyltransferase